MPANRGRVTEDQARDLVAYIRAFGPKSLARSAPALRIPSSRKRSASSSNSWTNCTKKCKERARSPNTIDRGNGQSSEDEL